MTLSLSAKSCRPRSVDQQQTSLPDPLTPASYLDPASGWYHTAERQLTERLLARASKRAGYTLILINDEPRRDLMFVAPKGANNMTGRAKLLGLIATAALLTAAPLSPRYSATELTVAVDRAEARVGRPLTPMSVAGVNRRVHRRAYYGAAAVGTAAAYGAYRYNRACGYYPYPPCY
jgi:hypothetical protein